MDKLGTVAMLVVLLMRHCPNASIFANESDERIGTSILSCRGLLLSLRLGLLPPLFAANLKNSSCRLIDDVEA
jgi:hypothetical protein